ncbi:MAG TPA: HAD family hydrolase [Acidimicrobiales bacterium]|nr:HAD family hydrolase [Acidimicrobiales bacterium]
MSSLDRPRPRASGVDPSGSPGRPRVSATDLDGTLLGVDGVVSARTVEALRAAHALGIQVVAATGRSHRTAAPKVAPVGVVDRAICSNGAMVVRLSPVVIEDHTPIPAITATAVVAALRAAIPDVGLGWEHLDGFGWDPTWVAQRPPTDGEQLAGVADDPPADTDLTKVLVTHPTVSHDALLGAIDGVLPPGVVASTSGAAFVEITVDGADKATALAALCGRWGVAAHEVLAFGDHRNDLGMLTWAGRGVAMGNAHPEVLAAADEVAPPNAADGVAEVIERLL